VDNVTFGDKNGAPEEDVGDDVETADTDIPKSSPPPGA
jgi:hypothetical protein